MIDRFYSAFQELDAEEMVALYHSDVEFEGPVFGKLKGNKAKNMWRMLCKSSNKINISFSNIQMNSENGTAIWRAEYIFSKTNRKINNKIFAKFEFKDDKIIKHRDNFNLYLWAIQAFGLKGFLIGWTPSFKSKLNLESNRMLDIYERRKTNVM